MCMCGKPTVNGEVGAYSWDGKSFMTRQPNAPDLVDGDTLIWDEPGRCGGIDAHSHHFRIVKRYGSYQLLVRHGGGDERHELCFASKAIPLDGMTSDERYWTLHTIYSAIRGASEAAANKEASEWRQAAAEKRIKTRKRPGRDLVKVWIEPKRSVMVEG